MKYWLVTKFWEVWYYDCEFTGYTTSMFDCKAAGGTDWLEMRFGGSDEESRDSSGIDLFNRQDKFKVVACCS